MRDKGKKKAVINKEETAENWCFVCKDGGALRICDYKQCLKSYHPYCLEKDDSFLESEEKWNCAWHNCYSCGRSSYRHCYTCTFAACRHCLPTAEILCIKGEYGFCNVCLKLALLIEKDKDYDSGGEKVDFTDRETCEGLFMEYYMIIKKAEGFELGDIYAAKDRDKAKKKHQLESGSEDFDDEEVELISDYDDLLDEKKCMKTHKRTKGRKSASKQTPGRSNKKEFIGWASRPLIEFLKSIGKSTSEKLSQHDVASIVNEYVKEHKLLNPRKKRMIMCDARLQLLFRKKILSRNRVRDLLEDHFAENHEESEEDELAYKSEDSNGGDTLKACKRLRKMDVEKKFHKENVEKAALQSRFASIVVENVKLAYLKRSVLKEMLKQPESFEEKVTGCFVRVKSDPNDCRSRKSHQLMQVEGVKTVPIGENNAETILLLSDMPKEIFMSLLSDEDFSGEECEDLRNKVLAGEIERLTVPICCRVYSVYDDYSGRPESIYSHQEALQQKAKAIHKDITNHWIRKELALLQNLIDRANEKGWRREYPFHVFNYIVSTLFEYLERRKRLQNPLEVSRLLENVPTVIPDVYEPDCDSEGIKNDIGSDQGCSIEAILPCNSSVPSGQQENKASEESTQHSRHTSPSETNQKIPERFASKEPQQWHAPNNKSEFKHEQPFQCAAPEAKRNTCSEKTPVDKPEKAKGHEGSKIEMIDIPSEGEDEGEDDDKASRRVIANRKSEVDAEDEMWCVKGPNGERNKSSLSVLKRWSESSVYASEFKIWKEDESEEDAIPLPEAIRVAFGEN
ncbi:hypothetical protein OROHE_007637 [Orobanche hederae]